MSPDPPVPGVLIERLRSYFAAFLPVATVDDAVESALLRVPTDRVGRTAVLRAGHLELSTRLRVAPEVEAMVLHDDLGLSLPVVAEVLDLTTGDVRQLIEAAEAEFARDAGAAHDPAAEVRARPDGSDREGTDSDDRATTRRGIAAVVGAGLIAAVLLGVFAAADRAPTCRDASELGITDLAVTDEVDASGRPSSDRDVLDAGAPVIVWIGYQRSGETPGPITVRWARAGIELYETDLQLPRGGQVHVTLAEAYATPGSYVVALREGTCEVANRRFELRG